MPRYAMAAVYEIDMPTAEEAWEALSDPENPNGCTGELRFVSSPIEVPTPAASEENYYEGTRPERVTR
jgi:hypothetical protein